MKKKLKTFKRRNQIARQLIERKGAGAGMHHTREHDLLKGRSRKGKHKKDDTNVS